MKNEKGFTLIELLVVIAIIGLLSTLAVVALGNARLKARDAKRQSNIKVLQTAIELYVAENGSAPAVPATWAALGDALAAQLPGGLPEDSNATTPSRWCYCKDSATTKYLIAVALEESKDIPGDLDNSSINGTYALASECFCSDGAFPSGFNCTDNGWGKIGLSTTGVTAMCLGSI